jgi:CHAD domain-containing protein
MTRAATSRETDPSARTLVGAAAAGATAAVRPPAAPKPVTDAERKYRLGADETIPDGLRRIARGRLADGAEALAGVTAAGPGEAVHATRKNVKRVRAALRLSRDAIGEDVYGRENTHMRMIAGKLARVRDARVLVDTLTALEERFEDELPRGATAALRARLEDDHERAVAALAEEGDLAERAAQGLGEARTRTAQWTFADDDFGALKPGLRRIYRRGRKQLRAARKEASAEKLHDSRKRVKDLWHAAQILRPAHPKHMKRLARDAHELADLLGEHHDLSVLRDYVEVNPQLFSGAAPRDALLAVLDRRRDTLRRKALKRGRRLYKRSPKRFVAAVEQGWRKRVAGARGSVAAAERRALNTS